MKVYSTAEFARFASKEHIGDRALCEAVERAEKGLIDADLAGPLIKQRVARPGQGRSRGYRTILAYRSGRSAIFLYGFSKSAKANLSAAEQDTFAEFGAIVLNLPEDRLDALVAQRKWRRIDCEQFREDVSE